MSDALRRFLSSGDTLSRLHDHARSLMRAQDILRRLLPQALADGCAVANLKGEVLVVSARNGSIASRLRQMAPTLAQGFGAQGLVLQNIQVKVGIVVEPSPPPVRPARALGEGGRRSLAELIGTLPEEAPLRASLQRLLDRSRAAD